MSTQIELDADFQYPDGGRNLIVDTCLVIFFSCFIYVMIVSAICNAVL